MRKKALAVASLLVFSTLVFAQESAISTIRKNIESNLPILGKIDDIRQVHTSPFYEVRIGGQIYYSDATGRYLMHGSIIDLDSKRNITEDRLNDINKIEFSSLPIDGSFSIKKGDGTRQIAVFADPNCGYCKLLEKDLEALSNVQIRIYLLPILGADSHEKARHIFCSKTPAVAWSDWMLRGKPPVKKTCAIDGINRNLDFAQKHRITGTPTIVLADGRRIAGAISAEKLQSLIDKPQQP